VTNLGVFLARAFVDVFAIFKYSPLGAALQGYAEPVELTKKATPSSVNTNKKLLALSKYLI
jgi:hypothetical protein